MPRTKLNDVVAFLNVARARSFTRAAAQLGVSQAALSQTIRGLEAQLGLRLLTRTTRNVAPTEAGERLLGAAGLRLDETDAELAALSELRVRVEGQLTFNGTAPMLDAALVGFGLAYLPEDSVETHLANGQLVRVIADWCPPYPGYQLYYPNRRQPTPAFALLVDALRYRRWWLLWPSFHTVGVSPATR